jgi:hypothetical protein
MQLVTRTAFIIWKRDIEEAITGGNFWTRHTLMKGDDQWAQPLYPPLSGPLTVKWLFGQVASTTV